MFKLKCVVLYVVDALATYIFSLNYNENTKKVMVGCVSTFHDLNHKLHKAYPKTSLKIPQG
jgi:hypothetical protein